MTHKIGLRYARISLTDVKVPKIDNQLADLAKLEASLGLTVPEGCTYVDDGIAASKPDLRDDFERLLADLPRYPGAVIIATEEARLARNNQEKVALTVACIAHGITWHTIRDGAVDPASAAGEFMAVIRGAVDTLESRRKGERQRARAAHDRAKGLPYKNSPRPFGRKDDHMTPRESEAKLIRMARDMLLHEGKSLFQVMTAWQEAGSKTPQGNDWTAASVRHAMKKWSNAAVPSYADEPLNDVQPDPRWIPIISREDVANIRALLELKATGSGISTLCGGLIYCRCGAPMVGGGWQGRNSGKRIYRCTMYTDNKIKLANSKGNHSTVARTLADAAARKAVINVYFVAPKASQAANSEAARLAALHAEITDVRAKIEAVLELHLDGKLSKAVFQKKTATLSARETELANAMAHAAAASANARMLTEAHRLMDSGGTFTHSDAVDMWQRTAATFDSLTLEDQRALLRATAHIVVGAGKGPGRFVVTGAGLPSDEDAIAV